jgi:urease accessory protein
VTTARSFLAALQLSDSSLPTGRFGHSAGLEAFLSHDPDVPEHELIAAVETHILESAGPLDGVAVAAAHRRSGEGRLRGLIELDRLVTARKLTPSSRQASTTCGRRLAVLADRLTDRAPATPFCAAVSTGVTDGNLAIVHGTLAQACDLDARQAVLIELRATAAALLSAATRLGRLPAIRAQAVLRELAPAIEAAAHDAEQASAESMHANTVELDIYALRHTRAEIRHFVT